MTKIFDYEIIYNYLFDLIKNDLEEHQKLPSENILSKHFNLSRATVRQGINKLKNEGLIYSKKGSGYFVNFKKITYRISTNTTFTNEIKKAGKQPKLKFIKSKILNANEYIASKLNININEKVLYLKNIRFVDDIPFLFAKYYINLELFNNLTDEFTTTNSISNVYNNFGLTPFRKDSEIDILSSNIKSKKIFCIQNDLPIIQISTRTIDKNTNKVIDYCLSNFRSDMAKIVVDYKDGN